MFLSRVTVTGFKSFASTTVLNLEPGVTAVVGPNGSGKSNLADAIRWALGEQSKGRLRLGGRDEVVFAGTEKKAKASFAQVVLLFNNEDGAMPLDLTEVEVSRRVYRSGESDYRLAGRSVRLSDIQALMVQAGFGVGTYAVIGQGMIDSFLMSPPAERKLLFDEAVGIRGPEQGREAALRKLESTNQNLVRLRDIAAELSPRLHSLQGVVDASSVTRGLEEAITGLRTSLARGKIAHWAGRQKELEKSKVSLSTQIDELRRELGDTEQKLAALSAKDEAHRAESERVQLELSRLESTRDQLGIELNKARGALAEANRSKELISQFNAELKKSRLEQTSARDRMKELETEFASNSEAAERALQAVERAGRLVADAQVALVDLRHSASDSSRDQYVDHALQILRTLATTLSGEEVELEQIRLLVHKAGRLLSHAGKVNATELLNELKAAQKKLETAMVKRETAVEHQTNVTITIRSLEIDLVHGRQAVERTDAEVERIAAKIEPLEKVAADLDHLKTLETNCASQAVNASAELEQLRQRSRELTVAFADAGRRSEHVAALERGKLMLANAERTYAGVEPELTAAKEAQVLAQSEAVEWQVNSDGPLSADTLDDLQSKLVLAQAQLEATTAAHRDQVAEYDVVDARHAELTDQIADLEAAQVNLGQVVGELDARIRDRFKSNFARLSEHFSGYFTQLFAGGTAVLELEQDEEGTYGVIIKVSPKGKRPTSIAALSGGERALAGVALLAAIIRTNPSPFIVLDEIDAALDETNSARLADILGSLKDHTQLIVITHNRQTMHAAQVLFGVTMDKHHTSSLLSMRLEDAAQLAAR